MLLDRNRGCAVDIRWPAERAWEWYKKHGWIVGCNFIPSTAVNQLEMWQADTFDAETIDRELALAFSLGMNAVRVFLHDLVWHQDPDGFKDRVKRFLKIAERHCLRTIFVIFDDCWYSDPALGPQLEPLLGVHNSRWLQSPGVKAALDNSCEKRLCHYVCDMVSSFRSDDRILMWDLYNEPGNFFLPVLSLPLHRKISRLAGLVLRHYLFPIPTLPLLRKALKWARESGPSQPVTVAIWFPSPSLNRELIENSDVISFHNYKKEDNLKKQIAELRKYGRPLICTEYMARTTGSTFESCLPIFKEEGVGCLNWGLVSGKTGTIYTWQDSGRTSEPRIWYHDIFRKDGTPYSEKEIAFIRKMTGADHRL